jgi:hypothetical protein
MCKAMPAAVLRWTLMVAVSALTAVVGVSLSTKAKAVGIVCVTEHFIDPHPVETWDDGGCIDHDGYWGRLRVL